MDIIRDAVSCIFSGTGSITAQLANRITELDERYAEPLSKIVDEVETLSQKVAAHLQAMGVA